MNRPSSFDARLNAWLEEGPTTGPDDLLADVHARARSVRQRPGWWLALKGDSMTTTWRARPAPFSGRLAFILLTALLLLAIAAATVLVGSRPAAFSDGPATDGAMAVAPVIPTGDEALLAFTSWASDETTCDLFVVRADGTDGRHITSDELCDWSPAWSPDGGELAFYSSDDDSIQLRVASADGIRVLDDSPGCFQSTQAPAWSPDGRFILYSVDRRPRDDDVCELSLHRRLRRACRWQRSRPAPPRRCRHRSSRDRRTGQLAGSLSAGPRGTTARAACSLGGRSQSIRTPVGSRGATSGCCLGPGSGARSGGLDLVARRDSPSRAPNPGRTGFGTALSIPDGRLVATGAARRPVPGTRSSPDWAPTGWDRWLTLLELTEQVSDHGIYHLVVVGRDGTEARTIETPELNGNGGPAMISPDGTLAAARAEIDVRCDARRHPGRRARRCDLRSSAVPAGSGAASRWQPVVNPDNPATSAPEGLPWPDRPRIGARGRPGHPDRAAPFVHGRYWGHDRAVPRRRDGAHPHPGRERSRTFAGLLSGRPRRVAVPGVRRLLSRLLVPGRLAAARHGWRTDRRQARRDVRGSFRPEPRQPQHDHPRAGLRRGVRDARRSWRVVPHATGRIGVGGASLLPRPRRSPDRDQRGPHAGSGASG